jgi:hypothetical protein
MIIEKSKFQDQKISNKIKQLLKQEDENSKYQSNLLNEQKEEELEVLDNDNNIENKVGKYIPPKLRSEILRTDKKSNDQEKIKSKSKNPLKRLKSKLVTELSEEYSERPLEIKENEDYQEINKFDENLQREEFERMGRINLSKQQKLELKRKQKNIKKKENELGLLSNLGNWEDE